MIWRIVLWVVGALVGTVLIAAIVGWMLPAEHHAESKLEVPAAIDSVWPIVSRVGEYAAWWPAVKAMERRPERDGHEVWLQRGRGGPFPIEIIEAREPTRMVTKIVDDGLPFGGTWTYVLEAGEGSTTVRITEDGVIHNPVFRVIARFFMGYHGTQLDYLRALAVHLGTQAAPVVVR